MSSLLNGIDRTPLVCKSNRRILESISDTQLNTCFNFNSPSSQKVRKSLAGRARKVSLFSSPRSKPAQLVGSAPLLQIPSMLSGFSLAKSCDFSLSSIPISKRKTEQFYKEHLLQTFQAVKFIRRLPEMDFNEVVLKSVKIPRRPGYENKKTVIFDLDETLVHTSADSGFDLGHQIRIRVSDEEIKAKVKIRPFARDCLREVAKDFEVIVFTASHKDYADAVIDHIDPSNELIHWRLYRDSCIEVDGVLIKDLRILLDRELKDLIIVDNSAYSFAYQVNNGIPIVTWIDDPCDRELFNLGDFLCGLANNDDVRVVLKQVFRMESFYEDYAREYLGV